MADGISELLLWIKDFIRNGLLNMPEKDAAYFENIARRIVDAQAPGLANMLRTLGEINFCREGWQSELLNQLLRIYLVATCYTNSDQLPEGLQQDLRNSTPIPWRNTRSAGGICHRGRYGYGSRFATSIF